jgi:hypothetical protein
MKACRYLLLLVSVLVMACNHDDIDNNCSGFNDPILDAWFPYGANPTVTFATSGGTTETYTMVKTSVTTPYTLTANVPCQGEKIYESTEKNAQGAALYTVKLKQTALAGVEHAVNINMKGIEMGLYGVSPDKVNTALVFQTSAPPEFLPSINLDGRTFTNVSLAKSDTSTMKAPRPYQVFFTKGYGVLAYRDYPSNTLWVRQ